MVVALFLIFPTFQDEKKKKKKKKVTCSVKFLRVMAQNLVL